MTTTTEKPGECCGLCALTESNNAHCLNASCPCHQKPQPSECKHTVVNGVSDGFGFIVDRECADCHAELPDAPVVPKPSDAPVAGWEEEFGNFWAYVVQRTGIDLGNMALNDLSHIKDEFGYLLAKATAEAEKLGQDEWRGGTGRAMYQQGYKQAIEDAKEKVKNLPVRFYDLGYGVEEEINGVDMKAVVLKALSELDKQP